jgi:plasmid stabilization system protein ParE
MPRWTIKAKEDLRAQLASIALDNNDAARDMAMKIKVSCAGLDQFPKIGRSGAVKETRELLIPNTPYVCVYRIVERHVEILRLLHVKMMWPE